LLGAQASTPAADAERQMNLAQLFKAGIWVAQNGVA